LPSNSYFVIDLNMNKKRFFILASIFLLAIIAFILFSDAGVKMFQSYQSANGTQQETSADAAIEQSRSTRRVQRDSGNQAIATHSYTELKDFMIPELKLENITFKQALYQLQKRYNEICKETGETPVSFRFKIQGESQRLINFRLNNLSFTAMLKTLAAIEGMAMVIEDRTISFSAHEKSGIKLTKTITVPPNAAARLTPDPISPIDPFSSDKNAPLPPRTNLSTIIRELFGLTESKISYLAASSTLVVNANSVDIARIESLVANYLKSPPPQIKTTSRIINVAEGAQFDPTSINQPDFYEKITSTPGIEIVSSPTVISRAGATATVQQIREVVSPTSSGGFTTDHTGLTIKYNTGLLGFGISSNTTFDRGYLTGDTNKPVAHTQISDEDFLERSSTHIIRLTMIKCPISS